MPVQLSSPRLVAKHLTISNNAITILEKVNIHIPPGELVTLLGANGVGKSTLLAAISGDKLPLNSGEVWLNELNVRTTSPKQLAQHRAVFTQKNVLDFNLSVREVVEMGCYPFPKIDNVEHIIQQTLVWTDTQSMEHRLYQQLSGGEQQRVQFARILVQLLAQYDNPHQQPRYCLLDEPLANLDPKYQQKLLKILQHLAHQYHIGILLILHDINLAAYYADRIVLLAKGKIIAQGKPAEILTPANLVRTYGIRGHCFPHPLYPDKVCVVWEHEDAASDDNNLT